MKKQNKTLTANQDPARTLKAADDMMLSYTGVDGH